MTEKIELIKKMFDPSFATLLYREYKEALWIYQNQVEGANYHWSEVEAIRNKLLVAMFVYMIGDESKRDYWLSNVEYDALADKMIGYILGIDDSTWDQEALE